ncbi:hypothetical protein [Knoellia koreensis]|uniref:Uncharacterized protein n=1 Tax=Knoellia koreensis TaxID=2730921 RepID=A0A849HBE5_9MICO|nr:hypothetical protein [Knoellia sp. DB2414S]NNM47200.1 hypothetical protein [Knoellia sp. DB2414S]
MVGEPGTPQLTHTAVSRAPAPRDRRARVRRVGRPLLAALLIGGWLAWATVTYVTQAREVSVKQFTTDLEAGDIVAFRAVSNVRGGYGRWAEDPIDYDIPATDASGRLLPPVEDAGSITVMYWTDNPIGRIRIVDDYSVPVEERIAALHQADVPPNTALDGPSDAGQAVALALGLVTLLAIIGGPVPTRGTRWFWFWVLGLLWGWGVVAYAVGELLRPRAPEAVGAESGAVPRRRRWSGWEGFAVQLVVGILGGLAAAEVSRLTGGVVIPRP